LASALRLVFSGYGYVGLAAAVFAIMFLALSSLSEFLFFEPYFVLYVSGGREAVFASVIAVSALSSLVIPMNVYRIKMHGGRARKMGGGLAGSILGVSAGACSCGPAGFAIISTFGTVGGIATSFLTVYEIPLRIISIGILGFIYYTTAKSIRRECDIS